METYSGIGRHWLQEVFIPLLGETFEQKDFSSIKGDLGVLEGVQFNSETVGGHLYFWGSGFVEFELAQLDPFVEIIPDTMIEAEATNFDELLAPLLLEIRKHR